MKIKQNKNWEKEGYTFEENGLVRYFNRGKHFEEMQISKYRDEDDFDRKFKNK